MNTQADVEIAIIGAGVIGSALAMALAELGAENISVYDPDLEGTFSSTELNAGGVRATFYQEANVICSKLSIDYFASHAVDVGYRPVGYLWMHGPEKMKQGLKSQERWKKQGWDVEAWDVSKLRSYAPFIDKTDDLAGAIFGPRDGLLNPNLLRNHFRERAKKKGVRFYDRLALRSSEMDSSRVQLNFQKLPTQMSRDEKESFFSQSAMSGGDGEFVQVTADRVVNCAGAWASRVAKTLGYESPSYCIRRQISLFDCREVDLSNYGMMIDSSGVYFHPEASYILSGVVEHNIPRGPSFHYDGESFFHEKIWLPLSERSSKFEALKHLSGWGGLYEVSPDESAIIGSVETGAGEGTSRIFESHSYSGHGVMHSYACGVALAEKMIFGKSKILDLSPFSGNRFVTGKLIPESAVI